MSIIAFIIRWQFERLCFIEPFFQHHFFPCWTAKDPFNNIIIGAIGYVKKFVIQGHRQSLFTTFVIHLLHHHRCGLYRAEYQVTQNEKSDLWEETEMRTRSHRHTRGPRPDHSAECDQCQLQININCKHVLTLVGRSYKLSVKPRLEGNFISLLPAIHIIKNLLSVSACMKELFV